MARNGKRITLWLPDDLYDHIEENRGWRTATDFIRNMIDADRGAVPRVSYKAKPRPKPVHDKVPDGPTWQEIKDIVSAQMMEEGFDMEEMFGANIEFYGEQAAWENYSKLPNCAERMARHEESLNGQ